MKGDNYDFGKQDYSKMMFNVYDVKQGVDLCHKYPKLAIYQEFQGYGGPDRNHLIRFVFYAYDSKSPLLEIKSLKERHTLCMDLAGVKDKKIRASILKGNYDPVKKMTYCFLSKIQSNRKFKLYIALEKHYDDMVENIYKTIPENEKGNQKQQQDAYKMKNDNSQSALELADRLKDLEKDIFPHFDEVRDLLTTDKQTSDLFLGSAEQLAEKVKARNGTV